MHSKVIGMQNLYIKEVKGYLNKGMNYNTRNRGWSIAWRLQLRVGCKSGRLQGEFCLGSVYLGHFFRAFRNNFAFKNIRILQKWWNKPIARIGFLKQAMCHGFSRVRWPCLSQRDDSVWCLRTASNTTLSVTRVYFCLLRNLASEVMLYQLWDNQCSKRKDRGWERAVWLCFVNLSVLIRNFMMVYSMCLKFWKFWRQQ